MKRKTVKLAGIAAALILTISFLIFSLVGGTSAFAGVAASPRPSEVLADLGKDKSFNPADFPRDDTDYSLKIIQIAESTDGKLLIYVYQPCAVTRPLIATSVNMSLSETVNGTRLYPLTYLSSDGVFGKYIVNGVTVREEPTRFYNITSILRKWDKDIDDPTGNATTITEVPYTVGQLWNVTTTENNVNYSAKEIEVVKILTKYPGFVRYSNSWNADSYSYLDSHYVAFTCDHKIDKLLNADLEFYTQTYKKNGNNYTYGEPEPHALTLNDYQVTGIYGQGVFKDNTEWHRIASVNDFFNEVGDKLSNAEKAELSKYDWILNFYETGSTSGAGWGDLLLTFLFPPAGIITSSIHLGTAEGVLVSEVAILRMEFEYDGQIYNLGVVDNRQTESIEPLKDGNYMWLVILIIVVIVIVILCVISKTFRKIFFGIIAAVTFPLWLPFWIIKKQRERERQRKGKRQAKSNKKNRGATEASTAATLERLEPAPTKKKNSKEKKKNAKQRERRKDKKA